MNELRGLIAIASLALSAGVMAGFLIFGNGSCGKKPTTGTGVIVHYDTIIKPVTVKEKVLIPEYLERVKIEYDTVFIENKPSAKEREIREYIAQSDTVLKENGCRLDIRYISPVQLSRDSYFVISVDCPPVVLSGLAPEPEGMNNPEAGGGFDKRFSVEAFIGYGASFINDRVHYAPVAGVGIGIRIFP